MYIWVAIGFWKRLKRILMWRDTLGHDQNNKFLFKLFSKRHKFRIKVLKKGRPKTWPPIGYLIRSLKHKESNGRWNFAEIRSPILVQKEIKYVSSNSRRKVAFYILSWPFANLVREGFRLKSKLAAAKSIIESESVGTTKKEVWIVTFKATRDLCVAKDDIDTIFNTHYMLYVPFIAMKEIYNVATHRGVSHLLHGSQLLTGLITWQGNKVRQRFRVSTADCSVRTLDRNKYVLR